MYRCCWPAIFRARRPRVLPANGTLAQTRPSRHYFSDVSLPDLYDVVVAHIHSLIDTNVSNISYNWHINLRRQSSEYA